MKRLVLFFVVLRLVCAGNAQQSSSIPYIEQLLMLGEYGKVIDTCQQLVLGGVEDDAIYYRMGLAYQNFLQEELALQFYQKALDLSPTNKAYNYVLAKSYFTAGNYGKAEPLFSRLCSMDSLNWVYAYHLTSIFTQQKRYDEAIMVYKKFWAADSLNYDYLNRIAYATMKKGEHEGAKELFYEALGMDAKNVTAMRNLAYIYTVRGEYDTALVYLGEGLKYEPENKAIYSGRAEINYALHLPNIAKEDYLKLLSFGDTTVLYLKRIGVGFSYNIQFDTAKYYMEKAFRLDSSDYEICCYLGQIYQRLKDLPKSEYYYSKAIKLLSPVQEQLAITYESLGDVQNKAGDRDGALLSFLETFDIMYGPGLIMKIANIYDEYLGDSENAIKYYELFLESDIYGLNGNSEYPPAYINQVKTRYDFLKEQQ